MLGVNGIILIRDPRQKWLEAIWGSRFMLTRLVEQPLDVLGSSLLMLRGLYKQVVGTIRAPRATLTGFWRGNHVDTYRRIGALKLSMNLPLGESFLPVLHKTQEGKCTNVVFKYDVEGVASRPDPMSCPDRLDYALRTLGVHGRRLQGMHGNLERIEFQGAVDVALR